MNRESFADIEVGRDIMQTPDEPLGLLHRDTRYLSRFQLKIARENRYYLNSFDSRENAQLQINLSNPDLTFNGETVDALQALANHGGGCSVGATANLASPARGSAPMFAGKELLRRSICLSSSNASIDVGSDVNLLFLKGARDHDRHAIESGSEAH